MLMTRPHVLGLTGKIATGKSTVAAMLAALGAEVLDCDRLAHESMAPGTATHAAVTARFPGVQKDNGELDRAALGRIVFADPIALAALEALTHPVVLAETRRRLAVSSAPVVVIEAIKLFESGLDQDCDEVLLVTASEEAQLQRLMDRRGLSFAEAERRMVAQASQEAQWARAQRVIDNSGTLQEAWRQVLALWRELGAHGAPQPAGQPRLPQELQRGGGVSKRQTLIYGAVLAVLFGIWAAINWLNADLAASQKLAVLALCGLTALACAWIVSRW